MSYSFTIVLQANPGEKFSSCILSARKISRVLKDCVFLRFNEEDILIYPKDTYGGIWKRIRLTDNKFKIFDIQKPLM